MKVFLLATLFCLLTTTVIAQLCPTTDPGYIRQPRPQGEPANYPPVEEPACFMQSTQANNTGLCFQCHPHQYQAWMRKYWRS